ncbi:TetR/AcrR family transcriptional regulator [Salidesulfovibrio onnuriiensis]|uniref:TetR/AcrR family transcriptional regulator n=1 Tax=Salidesulfovibrio onnuriiensis TaxID=2583823 RepID=UPI0011C8DD2B|nr:TetR/AcrR family transcriptional regulator [Salidesulfovibrio onnuriiensis]
MVTKQQEKSRQTMEELMTSAMELFGEKGFVQTSVSEITSRAGYAKGSFYRHWESKNQLFLQIIEQKLLEYRRARDRRIEDARDLEEALRIIWDFLESMVQDSQWAKVFLEFTIHSVRDTELRTEMRRRQYRLSETIFANLVRRFVTSDYPAEKIGALNTALFEGFMVHNALETGVLSLEDVRETAIALALSKGAGQG